MTPEDLVPAMAIALFAGLRGAAPGRRVLFVLPLAWFIGGLLGVTIEGLPDLPVPAISFFILGVLVAADPSLAENDEAREAAVDAVAQVCEDLTGANAAQLVYLEADDLTKDAARAGCPDRLAVTVDS